MSDFLEMDITDELVEELQLTISRLHDLWKEVGLPLTEQRDRLKSFKDTICHFYTKEENQKESLLRKVDEEGKELFYLSKELGVYSEEYFNDNGLTLIEMDERLGKNLRYLRSLVFERQAERETLLQQEQDLCEQLIEDATEPSDRDIPTLDELSNIQRHINTLEQEKAHRLSLMRGLKENIQGLLHELHQASDSKFLNSFMNSKEELFTLSLHNIEALKRIKRDLSHKAAENQRELKELVYKVGHLWDRLEVDESTRSDFQAALTNIIPKDIEIYGIELSRLEELKKANIAQLIGRLKSELEEWWQRCYVSEEDKKYCQAYSCDNNTEDELTALEEEVKRLERCHEDAQAIYSLLDKRKNLWDLLQELEARSTDPSRLFGNRGGSLLKEEKERNRIKQELPRVECELKETVERWEKEQSEAGGAPVVFSVCGLSVMDYISQEWEHYHQKKAIDAKERHSARTAQLVEDARLGTRPATAKRRLNATQSSRGCRAGAANSTGSTSGGLSLHHRSEASRSSAASRSRGVLTDKDTNVLVDLPPFGTTKGRSSVRRRASKRLRSRGQQLEDDDEFEVSKSKRRRGADGANTSLVTTYSQFANSIASRSEAEQVRSSVLKSPSTPQHQRPLSVPRGLRHSGRAAPARRHHVPVTPKASVSAAFATPSRSPAPAAMRAPRTLPNRRRSQRLNSQSNSRSGVGGSTLRLTTPTHNKLSFLI